MNKPIPSQGGQVMFCALSSQGGDRYSKLPAKGQLTNRNNSFKEPNPRLTCSAVTNADGRFELFTDRGLYQAVTSVDNTTAVGASLDEALLDRQKEPELVFSR